MLYLAISSKLIYIIGCYYTGFYSRECQAYFLFWITSWGLEDRINIYNI